jgi:hypothetical protein
LTLNKLGLKQQARPDIDAKLARRQAIAFQRFDKTQLLAGVEHPVAMVESEPSMITCTCPCRPFIRLVE